MIYVHTSCSFALSSFAGFACSSGSSSSFGCVVALDSLFVPENALVHLVPLPSLLEVHHPHHHSHAYYGANEEFLGHELLL